MSRPLSSAADLREELADLEHDRARLRPPIHLERRAEYLALLAVQETDLLADLARVEALAEREAGEGSVPQRFTGPAKAGVDGSNPSVLVAPRSASAPHEAEAYEAA